MASVTIKAAALDAEDTRACRVRYCDFLMAKFKEIASDEELEAFVLALRKLVAEASVMLPEDREDVDLVGMAFNVRR